MPRVLDSVHSPFHLPSHCGEKAPFPFTTTTSRSFRPSPASMRERNGNLAGWSPGEKYPSEGLKKASNHQSTNTSPPAANTHLNPAAIFPPARVRLRAARLRRLQTFDRDARALFPLLQTQRAGRGEAGSRPTFAPTVSSPARL